MSNCCFCFGKSKKALADDQVSLRKTPSDHYQMLIPEAEHETVNSLEGSRVSSEAQPETATDASSSLHTSERRNSASYTGQNNALQLYLPSMERFAPCSELVAAQAENFEMLFCLESSTDWEVKVDKPFACIMTRAGTSSHPDIALMKAFFDMELNVEPEDMYDIIYNPEVRKKWDTSIADYHIINQISDDVIHYYMLNKAPWPFKDRDFTEVRYIRRRVNGDMEIYFTGLAHHEYPEPKDKIIRGETIIGGQIFRKRISPITGEPTLMVTTICQADMRGEVPKKVLKVTLPSSVLKWYRSVKKQLQLRVTNNLQ